MTIYDIAKEAGVSASTVSRVMNNKKGISEKTRRRIQQLLEENNFVCNETARGLSTQSSRIIGILLEDIRISHHTGSVYVIEQEMTDKGYTCIIFSTGNTYEQKENCIRMLEQRRVDGVILIGSIFETKKMRELIKKYLENIPVVIANGWIDLPNVYGVLVDEEGGVESCVEYLASCGYTYPAYVKMDDTSAAKNKLSGFRKGIGKVEQYNKNAVIYDISVPDTEPIRILEAGAAVTEKLLKEHPDVDAIIYEVDLLAIGGLKTLEEMELSVPEQTGIIGIDNTIYGEICRPTLTTLDNKLVEISKNAAGILTEVLEKQDVSHRFMLFTDIIERKSTRHR